MNPYQQNPPQNNGFYNTTGQSFGNPMPITEFPPLRPLAPQLGYPNAPGGQQMPPAYPQISQGYPHIPQAHTQIPQAHTQIPQAHTQIPQVYAQNHQSYPQSSPYQGITPIPSQSFPSQGFTPPAPIGFRQTSLPQGNQVYPQPNQFQGPSSSYNQPQSQQTGGMPGAMTAHHQY